MMKVAFQKPKYYLDANGEFVIENYNHAKPFANFFPGIAGKYGIPMWTFYVNRAQAISSFGTKDKDHAILEFFPANRAWQMVSYHGFRTFLKLNNGKGRIFYEPFHNGFINLGFKLENKLRISPSGLALEEDNLTLGLNIKVEYFNIPNDTYAGLTRILTVSNTGRKNRNIQLIDGISQIIPYGTSNFFLKKLGRTIEAWMNVENLKNNAPYFRLTVDPTDRPEVIHIKEGNFYLGFQEHGGKALHLRPIVDPQAIFGPVTDFSMPQAFLAHDKFAFPKDQITRSKTPCAFSLVEFNIPARRQQSLYSIIGSIRDINTLNSSLKRIASSSYLAAKRLENKGLIAGLMQRIETRSSSRAFNLYCQQTYLDNIMRGGHPMTFDTENVFYLYSRKHGDLERDYNKFSLQPAYFSQGNGNYRDLNQNRRCDVWFNPKIKEENLITFFNLIQADGFNPLVVKGVGFALKDAKTFKPRLLQLTGSSDATDKILSYLNSKHFTPGEVILFLEDSRVALKVDYDEFLDNLLTHSIKIQEADHGEGFWTDHWHYCLDQLESFLGVYPEKMKEILFEKMVFTYFDNIETVKPRSEKYLLYHGAVRQLHSLGTDNGKRELIRKRHLQPHLSRDDHGEGDIYYTTLINKLLCLLANKFSSLDPFGTGIEMEADKPNWFDALNGLPALLGSSTCETFELKRLILIIERALKECLVTSLTVTQEVHELLLGLNTATADYYNSSSADKDYEHWDKTHSLKEAYRLKTRHGFKGAQIYMPSEELLSILANLRRKVEDGLMRAYDAKINAYSAYFINEVTAYDAISEHLVRPLKFRQRKLPLFLEAQMHAIRLSNNKSEAQRLYAATRKSPLFDKKLKMYKVTAPLSGMPEEIGRCRVFTPGWLENESVWLHMEYKFLLEALKQGLYDEFYADFKNALIPFQDPLRYGRSILENSSFIVSSAFPDKSLHGNGFVARLSGSTAELLQIWLTMNIGKEPFFLDEAKRLNLRLEPCLPGWLFDRKGNYSFRFLGKITVTYHNPKRKNTFGIKAVKVSRLILKDKAENLITLSSNIVPPPAAERVRAGEISSLDAYLD